MNKIKKILIANRGEISSRVIRTCRELGIETVSIFAEDDKELSYVGEATQSVSLGSGDLAETYLNIDKILKIASDFGCDAIHPGYGFLSENAIFAERIHKAGLIFIGPSVHAINLMGDKQASKKALEKFRAPLVPGYHGDEQGEDFLKEQAVKIGFPVLIKATAGGGGKGMRIVRSESDFLEEVASAKREALKAFSNDKVLIEKYIDNPRHIEVQVMGDHSGEVLHFFERECSIQRRYQKVIEETPSPALSDDLRRKICLSAVNIAKSIQYENAGTVEFILAPDNSFYFLEMNTRLQVEHPVTEMVTGFDLVELQILVASGEKLKIKQTDISQRGHAIECRIYAEDADNNFMPSIGIIEKMGKSLSHGVRWDASFKEGNRVSINYDPMIGKLITYADTRQKCIEKMKLALNDLYILGFKTNHNFLLRILSHKDFIAGEVDTHFLVKKENELKKGELSKTMIAKMMALFETGNKTYPNQNVARDDYNPWLKLTDWRIDS